MFNYWSEKESKSEIKRIKSRLKRLKKYKGIYLIKNETKYTLQFEYIELEVRRIYDNNYQFYIEDSLYKPTEIIEKFNKQFRFQNNDITNQKELIECLNKFNIDFIEDYNYKNYNYKITISKLEFYEKTKIIENIKNF